MYDNYIESMNVQGIDNDIHDSGRGQPNGVATLDATGRIPYDQLPESAMNLKGDWDASTNEPHLEAGVGTIGDMYFVSVAGTQDLGQGEKEYNVDDRILYNGEIWRPLSATGVESVNNKNGNVTLYGTDIQVSQENGRNIPQAIADSKYNTTFTDTADAAATVRNLTVPYYILDSVNKPSFDIFFANGWNTSFSLNVNELGEKDIKVYKNGGKVALYEKGHIGTVLRVIYDGTDFVVVGNPVVYTEDDKMICADGTDLGSGLAEIKDLGDGWYAKDLKNGFTELYGYLIKNNVPVTTAYGSIYYASVSIYLPDTYKNKSYICPIVSVRHDGVGGVMLHDIGSDYMNIRVWNATSFTFPFIALSVSLIVKS